MNDIDARRAAIAETAIELIAREGLRGLTHRAVDARLGLPAGSTSYYARTRQALLELVVGRLASRTLGDLAAGPAATDAASSIEEVAARLATLLDVIASRADDQRARFALAVDLQGDPALHPMVTSDSPIRRTLLAAAEGLLTTLRVEQPERHALGLLAVVDGLLFDRLAGSGVDPAQRADAELVLTAYLRGLRGAA